MALAGIDPLVYLSERDNFQRSVMAAVAQKTMKEQETLYRNLANMIADAVGRMLGGR